MLVQTLQVTARGWRRAPAILLLVLVLGTLAAGITPVRAQVEIQQYWSEWEARRQLLPAYQYAVGRVNPHRPEGLAGGNYFFAIAGTDYEARRNLYFNELFHLYGASVRGERTIEYGKGVFALVVDGKYEGAISELAFTLNNWPNHPECLQLMAVIALTTGRFSLAVERFETAIRLYPEYGWTYFQYSQFLAKTGMVDEAHRVATRGLDVEPTFTPLREFLEGHR